MALVSGSIPNLINGVSQQPFALRLPTQAELQENALSSVVDGLLKRPNTQHVAKLSATPLVNPFLHTINRDASERYAVVITNGNLQVFDLADGSAKTVAFPNGTSYLTSVDPKSSFRAVTVADFTFVVNMGTTVQAGASLSPTRTKEALIVVKQGNYGKKYSVTIDGTNVTYETANGKESRDQVSLDTSEIARTLLTGTRPVSEAISLGFFSGTALNSLSGFTVTRYGNVLHVVKDDNTDFEVTVEDGFNGNAMTAIRNEVQMFSDLPNNAPDGYHVEVVGDMSGDQDNYYVQFEKDGSSGVWKETVAQGLPISLNPATMPHILVREADGTFTFKVAEWGERVAGDDDSAPMPSFVGRKINDLFFYRNRLGFLSDENVIFSRAGEFFEFFPATVTTILDGDPIDVASTHTKVSILYHAVPFSENLLLFSDQTQFIVRGGDLLTPQTISINQTTEFVVSLKAKPVAAGRNLYFPVNRGPFDGVMEYFTDNSLEVNDANDVTGHVPRYVPSSIFKIAAAPNEDMLAVLSEGDPNAIYIYRYYWEGAEKLQSSWSRWTFGSNSTVLNADFIDSTLNLIVQRSDGVYLEKLSVEIGRSDPGSTFVTLLDRRLSEAQTTRSYNSSTKRTTITLPYSEPGDVGVVIRSGNAGLPQGVSLNVTRVSPSVIEVPGNHTSSLFYVGLRYRMRYQFSPILLRQQTSGGGVVAVQAGRLQLRNVSVAYSGTGYFQVDVTPSFRDTFTYQFTGRIMGSGLNILDQVPIEKGQFRFPVKARNTEVTIEVSSDSHLPVALLNAEWEGFYDTRSQRI